MRRRLSIGLSVALATALAWSLLGPSPATGGGSTGYATFAAPAFTQVGYSVHNNAGNTVCDNFAAPADVNDPANGENRGDLDNGNGSYLANVQLPQGARVTRLEVFFNDFDAENVHVFLVRKKTERGMPFLDGYRVMAKVKSAGAVNATMRRAATTNIKGARIRNDRFYYYLEMVECGNVEPHAVRIRYET